MIEEVVRTRPGQDAPPVTASRGGGERPRDLRRWSERALPRAPPRDRFSRRGGRSRIQRGRDNDGGDGGDGDNKILRIST